MVVILAAQFVSQPVYHHRQPINHFEAKKRSEGLKMALNALANLSRFSNSRIKENKSTE